jgi:hypothetical protein
MARSQRGRQDSIFVVGEAPDFILAAWVGCAFQFSELSSKDNN